MILPPSRGDVYIVLKPVPVEEGMRYKIGGTVTLLSSLDVKQEKWKCIDEFGVSIWTWISYRVKQGELKLLCKARSKR